MYFRQKTARRTTLTKAECFAKPILFEPWDKMPADARKEFTNNGPIPCEGGGVPGQWCDACRFGEVRAPEDE